MNKPNMIKVAPAIGDKNPLSRGKVITPTQDQCARALETAIANALTAFSKAPSAAIFEQNVSVRLAHGQDEQAIGAILRQHKGYTGNFIQRGLPFDKNCSDYREAQNMTFFALNEKWRALLTMNSVTKERATMTVFDDHWAKLNQANTRLNLEMQNGGE